MKKEKIEELFENNQTEYTMEGEWFSEMTLSDFVQAINQAELEWYKKLEKELYNCGSYGRIGKFYEYRDEIQNKIKELENGHSQDR